MRQKNNDHSTTKDVDQRPLSRWQGVKQLWNEEGRHDFYNVFVPEIAGILGVSVGITITLMLILSLIAVVMHGNTLQTASQIHFYFSSLSYDIFSNVLLSVVLLRYGFLCLAKNSKRHHAQMLSKSNPNNQTTKNKDQEDGHE